MNIGIVCYPTFGGSGVVATELGIEAAKLGHNVHFITYRQPARLSNVFLSNVLYHEVRMSNYPLFDFLPYETLFVSQLVDIVLNYNIDVLHVHYAIPFAAVGYMLRQILQQKQKQLPLITTLHGTDITLLGKERIFAPMVEFSINHSTAVTAVSEFLKRETEKNFHIEKDIQVIYNFIDPDIYDIPASEHLRQCIAPQGERILTHISNFRKVKRASDVVQVFLQVLERVPAKLLLIGDGPERQHIEEQCREGAHCKDILFLGKKERVAELLRISDLFILPSETESFGLAALEAMAAGVPILTSDVGGLPELNQHGKTGFMAKPQDIAAMASYAIQILTDPNLHQTMSVQAKQRANEFSKDRIIPSYMQLYRQLVAKGTNQNPSLFS